MTPRYRLFLILILAVTVFIYGRSLNYGTVNWDDALSRKAEQGYAPLDRQELIRIITPRVSATYQPVRELTSALLARVSGPDTWWPYHLVSLVLYLGTILLFYFTVLLLLTWMRPSGRWPKSREWGALLATAFFAFHPGHVEVTAWALGQKDTLVGLFYLGSFYFYMRSVVITRRELVFSFLLYLLALGSKPTAISLVLVLPLFDRIFRSGLFESPRPSKLLGVYALYLLPALAWVSYFVLSSARIEAINPLIQAGRIGGALGFSTIKLVLPMNLCLRYPAFNFTGLNLYLYLAIATAILFWIVHSYRKRKPYAFFACWALIALLPNMNLVPTVIERADRYYYLASMGFSGLVGYAGIYLYSIAGRGGLALKTLVVLILICLATISFRQVGFWKDGPAAWGRVLSIYPNLVIARVSLGHSYLWLGENEKALEIYQALLKDGPLNIEALKGMAYLLVIKGDKQGAINLLRMLKML